MRKWGDLPKRRQFVNRILYLKAVQSAECVHSGVSCKKIGVRPPMALSFWYSYRLAGYFNCFRKYSLCVWRYLSSFGFWQTFSGSKGGLIFCSSSSLAFETCCQIFFYLSGGSCSCLYFGNITLFYMIHRRENGHK